ncbi:hypothetical protein [Janthinobacterium agaricidamnosum]|uniref:hypothetical protein n=1 Tax=Janthinobacterium agaricidamnosum TaxID=55508 RepID=UPI000A7790B0|nr:hypothetical protein [Janthinobacterium agaricidamnosum]
MPRIAITPLDSQQLAIGQDSHKSIDGGLKNKFSRVNYSSKNRQGSVDDTHISDHRQRQVKFDNMPFDNRCIDKKIEHLDLIKLSFGNFSGEEKKILNTPEDISKIPYAAPSYVESVKSARLSSRESHQVKEKSAGKYDRKEVALLNRAELEKKLASFEILQPAVPSFISDFIQGLEREDRTGGYKAHPEQFTGTKFLPGIGGFLISPNESYVPKGKGAYDDPKTVKNQLGGMAVLGYYVPDKKFNGHKVFNEIFKDADHGLIAGQEIFNSGKRENAQKYKERTGLDYLSTFCDLRKKHIPLLENFRSVMLAHLQDIYAVDPKKDKIQLYMHKPLYGDPNVGLHIHARINQANHPGELDIQQLNFDLDETIKILKDVPENEIKEVILNKMSVDGAGKKYVAMAPIWAPKEYEGIASYSKHSNPWFRPEWSR